VCQRHDSLERLLAREVEADRKRFAGDRVARPEDLGLLVPGDLSVVGFDDTSTAARSHPGLTTIRQPHQDKGRIAADRLLSRHATELFDEPLELPTELVVRRSGGPRRP